MGSPFPPSASSEVPQEVLQEVKEEVCSPVFPVAGKRRARSYRRASFTAEALALEEAALAVHSIVSNLPSVT